jgi:Zn-dependent M16 (insulinase) family peptidase
MSGHFAGFELVREQSIPELDTEARLFRHIRTGAEVLSLVNRDENKTFAVTFRTLPSDDTGVAHILEHSVLSGSRKYPVKELFMELLKGSCATFINAMTFPDKTCYPVASTNLKDFYNLVDVYFDVVLNPLLEPYTLDQEGWHFELDAPNAPLCYKGVVFNEMKGAYSQQDAHIGEQVTRALLPNTIYAHSSGGDPRHIPELSYAHWHAFHQRFYHPSNARICFWGDDPEETRLQIVDAALKPFDRQPVSETIALQSRFAVPCRSSGLIPAAAADAQDGRGAVSIGWLLSDGQDTPEVRIAIHVLKEILVGSPASPLRKALLDSGLGEDLIDGADWDELRQPVFVTGLKGVCEASHDRVESLVLDTLDNLVRSGIDPAAVDAALNTVEFALRENGTWARGVGTILRSLEMWLYEGDPVAALAFEQPLRAVRAGLAKDPRYFEKMIEQYLLTNPHRSMVQHLPDAELLTRQEADEKMRLAKIRSGLADEELQKILAKTRELKRRQETPNSPAALAKLPMLRLADLDRKNSVIPREVMFSSERPIIHNDLSTNGIAYIDVGFDLQSLSSDELAYVPVLARALIELGTDKEDEVTFAHRIARYTGGIEAHAFALTKTDAKSTAAWLVLRGKATMAKTKELIEILRDLLLSARLDQRERVHRLVLEEKAQLESNLAPRGSYYCGLRLKAGANESGFVNEQMYGVTQLALLRRLAAETETNWPTVLARLDTIRSKLIVRASAIANVTADAKAWIPFRGQIEALLASLPDGNPAPAVWQPLVNRGNEGLVVPTQVNYVAKGTRIRDLAVRPNGAALAVCRWLSLAWLIPKIREQGGAYGASLDLERYSGYLGMTSYRDPNLFETLATFDGTAAFLRGLELSDSDLARSIIGALNGIDPYQLPGAKGFTSLTRYLAGQTEADRQKLRDELFATTAMDFRNFAAVMDSLRDRGQIVVMGPETTLSEANRTRGGDWLALTKVL